MIKFVMLICVLALVSSATVKLNTVTFRFVKLCDVSARMYFKCMTFTSNRTTVAGCCVKCSSLDKCVGASVNNGTCYLHSACSYNASCSVQAPKYKFYARLAKPQTTNSPPSSGSGGLGGVILNLWFYSTYQAEGRGGGLYCRRSVYNCSNEINTNNSDISVYSLVLYVPFLA